MHVVDPHTLSVGYRLVHLVGMAVLMGGAVQLAFPLTNSNAERRDYLLNSAARYEWLFWPVIALQVLTGIGNLGILGPAVPGPATSWGSFLTVKLAIVVAALVLSLIRTGAVAQIVATPDAVISARGMRLMRLAYLGTALILGAVVLFASRLAHG